AGRCHPDRDDLLLAWHRQVADRVDLPARLSGAPGRDPAGGDRGDAGQSERGPALWPDQPAHPAPALERISDDSGDPYIVVTPGLDPGRSYPGLPGRLSDQVLQ